MRAHWLGSNGSVGSLGGWSVTSGASARRPPGVEHSSDDPKLKPPSVRPSQSTCSGTSAARGRPTWPGRRRRLLSGPTAPPGFRWARRRLGGGGGGTRRRPSARQFRQLRGGTKIITACRWRRNGKRSTPTTVRHRQNTGLRCHVSRDSAQLLDRQTTLTVQGLNHAAALDRWLGLL